MCREGPRCGGPSFQGEIATLGMTSSYNQELARQVYEQSKVKGQLNLLVGHHVTSFCDVLLFI